MKILQQSLFYECGSPPAPHLCDTDERILLADCLGALFLFLVVITVLLIRVVYLWRVKSGNPHVDEATCGHVPKRHKSGSETTGLGGYSVMSLSICEINPKSSQSQSLIGNQSNCHLRQSNPMMIHRTPLSIYRP